MTTATPTPTEITNLVAQVLQIDADLVTPDARFIDLGRTSLAEIELLTAIEDRYRIKLDFETFVGLKSVSELSDAIALLSSPPPLSARTRSVLSSGLTSGPS